MDSPNLRLTVNQGDGRCSTGSLTTRPGVDDVLRPGLSGLGGDIALPKDVEDDVEVSR